MGIGYKAWFTAPIVDQEITIRIPLCKDKRRKWRARRNKTIERKLDKIIENLKESMGIG